MATRAPKIRLDSIPRSKQTASKGTDTAARPAMETNGALAPAETVASLTASSTPAAQTARAGVAEPEMQEANGLLATAQPRITSVNELLGRRAATAGTIASFESLASYTKYLNGLTLGALHRHAVEEAKLVPIDDRSRLIRRLEGEWTSVNARYPGRKPAAIPQFKPFTKEQTDAQAAIMNGLLRR